MKVLVYIAAIVPDEGETVGEVFTRIPLHPKLAALQPDPDGFLWLDLDACRSLVPDVPQEETALALAAQKPFSIKCMSEPVAKAAWREKPSWFLVAEDDVMFSPETQRFTAQRMKSTVVSLPVGHSPLLVSPDAVADVIEQAAHSAV